MGVYLPNVDMPKDDKFVTIQISPDGSIWQQYRGTVPNAKAVPIPRHGRLIDADEFLKRAIGTKCFRGDFALMLEELVGESTTIIEAEEGE